MAPRFPVVAPSGEKMLKFSKTNKHKRVAVNLPLIFSFTFFFQIKKLDAARCHEISRRIDWIFFGIRDIHIYVHLANVDLYSIFLNIRTRARQATAAGYLCSEAQCIMGKGHTMTPFVDRQTDRHDFKHCLPATLLAGSRINPFNVKI